MFQILIVDDDKNLKRALSLLLTDSGYRTFSAGSAREALHTLEKCRIDLMVLEAALPGHGWSRSHQTPSGLQK